MSSRQWNGALWRSSSCPTRGSGFTGPSTCRFDLASSSLGHAARHEATDGRAEITAQRPHHRPASPVRLGDHGIIRNIDPFVVEANAVMAVPRFPINIGKGSSIRERAAQALAGRKLVEPFIELGMAGVVRVPEMGTQRQ